MNVRQTTLPGVLLFEPSIFSDSRGFFFEAFNAQKYAAAGILRAFVQDNISYSRRGVLRGLHFQEPQSQGKLVQVLQGEVFDVAVDVRRGSPTFSRWFGEYLSSANKRQLFVPRGFAHGFVVTSDEAVFGYKCDAYYRADADRTIRWDDPSLGIAWPVREVLVSEKDQVGRRLAEFRDEELPSYDLHVGNRMS